VGDEGSEGAQSQEPKDYDFWASHLSSLVRLSCDVSPLVSLVLYLWSQAAESKAAIG